MNRNSLRILTIKAATQEEILLVEGLKANDKFSFNALHKNYSYALLGIIFRIVKHHEDAEDVLQETFIKISRNIHQYDDNKSRFFTWMARIAKHKSLDYVKTASAKNEANRIDLIDIHQYTCKQIHINSLNIETLGLKQLTFVLNNVQREVIDLMYFKGYTQVEIAKQLEIPLGTVKTKARMAIIELRKLFTTP